MPPASPRRPRGALGGPLRVAVSRAGPAGPGRGPAGPVEGPESPALSSGPPYSPEATPPGEARLSGLLPPPPPRSPPPPASPGAATPPPPRASSPASPPARSLGARHPDVPPTPSPERRAGPASVRAMRALFEARPAAS
eukprot:tig00000808_g4436.t1